MKRPIIVYLVACLWCWATLLPLRAVPLWVNLSGGGAPSGGVQSPTTSDMIAWWALGGLTDASGNSRTLTGQGAEDHVTGKVGNAVRFDASSEWGTITDASWQEPTGSFTVGGWFRISDATPTSARGVVSKTDYGTDRCWLIQLNTNRTITATVSTNSTTTTAVATTPDTLTTRMGDDAWHFIVMVFTASTKLEVFFDGVSAATDAIDIPVRCYDSASVPFNIWNYDNTANAGSEIRYADEVFMANRAYTSGEIEWLYNSGNGRTYTDL